MAFKNNQNCNMINHVEKCTRNMEIVILTLKDNFD